MQRLFLRSAKRCEAAVAPRCCSPNYRNSVPFGSGQNRPRGEQELELAAGSSELAARSRAGGGTGVGDERVDAGEQEAQQVLDLSHADECVMQSVMGY